LTLGKGDCINLWNDYWCFDICISKLVKILYSGIVRLYSIVSSTWRGTHWNFLSFVVILCYFSSLMVNKNEHVPNWTLDVIDVLLQKVAKFFTLLV